MDLATILDVFLHLDAYLNQAAAWLGPWLYLLLFLIIFCETGLVVTPFLPGDSLLFAVGALTAVEGAVINYPLTMALLIIAGILGDATNYSIGRYLGPKVFKYEDSFWLNKQHLLRTQKFYDQHGGKTIVWARFMPIVRTFAPFVAGIGHMTYSRFAFYNVFGAILWVVTFLTAGRFFGNIPQVKSNFHYVILGIIVISFMPLVIEFIKARREKNRALPNSPGL